MFMAVFMAGSIILWSRPIRHVRTEIVLLVKWISKVVLRKTYRGTRQADGNGVGRGGDFGVVWPRFELWDGDGTEKGR